MPCPVYSVQHSSVVHLVNVFLVSFVPHSFMLIETTVQKRIAQKPVSALWSLFHKDQITIWNDGRQDTNTRIIMMQSEFIKKT